MATSVPVKWTPVDWAKSCFDVYVAPPDKGVADGQVAELIISLIENVLKCRPKQYKVLVPRLRAVLDRFDKPTTTDGGDLSDGAAGESDQDEKGKSEGRFVAVKLLKKPVSFNAYCAAVPMDDAAELAAALDFDFQQLNMQKRGKKEDDGGDEADQGEKSDAINTKEKGAGVSRADATSAPRLTGLHKQVMQMEDIANAIDTYLENNPRKNREAVTNTVVVAFRQYLDQINKSAGKLADKGYVRFAVALEFALKAYDPVEYAKIAYETLQAFASMRDKKVSLVLDGGFMATTKPTSDLVRYSDDGVDLPALSQALTKLRATLNMDRLVRMVWAMDCYQLLQFFEATVQKVKQDIELCRENKASGIMKRQLPTLTKNERGRKIAASVNDHLVNLNLHPGRAHDEYAANQTRECLSEARNVGRAVKVIIKARGNGEEYENPGLIFAWLLGDKGVNRMHASRLSATAQVAFDIILNHVATDPLFDGELMRACHYRLFEIVTLRVNTSSTKRPLPIEQSLSMLQSTISSPADLYAALVSSEAEPGSRLVEVHDTPKKLRETGEEFRVHQGGLIYPQSHTQSPMPKVPTVAERNAAMQEEYDAGHISDLEMSDF